MFRWTHSPLPRLAAPRRATALLLLLAFACATLLGHALHTTCDDACEHVLAPTASLAAGEANHCHSPACSSAHNHSGRASHRIAGPHDGHVAPHGRLQAGPERHHADDCLACRYLAQGQWHLSLASPLAARVAPPQRSAQLTAWLPARYRAAAWARGPPTASLSNARGRAS